MAGNIVVIDTETTWRDEVMSLGAVIADPETFQPIDSRYYLIEPYYRYGGMYSDVLELPTVPKPYVGKRAGVDEHLRSWLKEYEVQAVCAYNAKFDKAHMPSFSDFRWLDIMRLAAYRQYNARIPSEAVCCRTGRLKTGYGVESVYRMLSGNCNYCEVHNGWHDAIDELKIMEMLNHPLSVYEIAEI